MTHASRPNPTYDQRYKATHREYFARKQREYLARLSPEERKRRKDADYQKHRLKRLAQQKEYAARNHDLLLNRKAAYRERNRQRLRDSARVYYLAHQVEAAVWRDNRRARLANVPGTYTPVEYYLLLKEYDFRCGYCGNRTTLVGDHRIPLARAELNPTNYITNIIPACIPCNGRKHIKTEAEFRGGSSSA